MKFTPAVLLGALICTSAAGTPLPKTEYPLLPTFAEYVELYGKTYGGCSKARARAKERYLATVSRIVRFNKLKDVPFEIEINRFSDGEPPKGYNFKASESSSSSSSQSLRRLHSLEGASIVVEEKKHHHKGYRHHKRKHSSAEEVMTIEQSEEM